MLAGTSGFTNEVNDAMRRKVAELLHTALSATSPEREKAELQLGILIKRKQIRPGRQLDYLLEPQYVRLSLTNEDLTHIFTTMKRVLRSAAGHPSTPVATAIGVLGQSGRGSSLKAILGFLETQPKRSREICFDQLISAMNNFLFHASEPGIARLLRSDKTHEVLKQVLEFCPKAKKDRLQRVLYDLARATGRSLRAATNKTERHTRVPRER